MSGINEANNHIHITMTFKIIKIENSTFSICTPSFFIPTLTYLFSNSYGGGFGGYGGGYGIGMALVPSYGGYGGYGGYRGFDYNLLLYRKTLS